MRCLIYPTFYCPNNILENTNYEKPHYENFQRFVYFSYSYQNFIVIKIAGKKFIYILILYLFLQTGDSRTDS